MKKKKIFIFGIVIFLFGFYIISNNINVEASTYYDTITSDNLDSSNATIKMNTSSIPTNDGTSDSAFTKTENTIYKPTELFYFDTGLSIWDDNDLGLWDDYQANIEVSSNFENNKQVINVNPSQIYNLKDSSKSGWNIKITKLKIIENIHPNYDCYVDYTTIAESSSNQITLSTSQKNCLVLIEYTLYDYRGVEQTYTYESGQSAYEGEEDYNCYLLTYISLGSSVENASNQVISNNITLSNCRVYKYANDGSNDTISNDYYSSSQPKTLSEEGKYKIITYYYNTTTTDKTFYLYIVKDKEILIKDENNNIITSNVYSSDRHISNTSKIKLEFKTSLHKNYLKEIIDNISFTSSNNSSVNITYSSDTKNKIINGESIALNIETNQIYDIVCQIDEGKFFDSYKFRIDTENPEFNVLPLENQAIINYLGSTAVGQVFLTAKAVKITWTKENCELKINDSTKNYNYDEINHLYYFDLTSPGNYEIKIESESGAIVKKNIYIREEVFLIGVTQNNTLYKSDLESNPYFTEIKLDATAYFNCDDIDETKEYRTGPYPASISYTMYLNGELYEPNTLINEEGEYNLHIEYNIGSSFDYNFTIDRTSPYMNVDYLKSQGYGSLNSWYNTVDENGTIYSFSYYSISEDNRLGAYQYAYQREQTYFTDKIPISDWEYKSIKLGLENITTSDYPTGEDYVYVYKKTSGTGYVAYYQYANYLNSLQTNVKNSIKESYSFKGSEFNPYPDDRYFNYLVFQDNDKSYPIFYMNEAYKFNHAVNEIGNINYDITIYNGSTKTKIEEQGLYKIIETDLAGNSTIYFIYYQTSNPEIDIFNNGQINYSSEKNLSSLFKVIPSLSMNTYNPSYYSIISYKYNGEQLYYNCYDVITNTYNNLEISSDGIYEFSIYSIFNNQSLSITVKLYQKEIIDEISIVEDEEEEPIGLLVKFSLEEAIQQKQITAINIFKDGNNIFGETDSNGIEIKITNDNSYSFYFTQSGNYKIQIYELCGHKIEREFDLAIGLPHGLIYKNINTDSGTELIRCDETTVYHNNSIYFKWNTKKTSYTATLTNLKTNTSISYQNGDKIQNEGNYKITLMNGDKFQEYFIYIDKTAPTGFIIDSLTTNSEGYIIGSNSLPTSSQITKTTYISGNREGISLNSLENDVFTKLVIYDSISQKELYQEMNLNTVLTGVEGEETTYTIILYDRAGNETKYILVLDYKLASFTINAGTKEIYNNSYVNQSFKFSSNENITIENITDGIIVNIGQKITYELSDIKTFNFLITDEYGNIGYVTIYYDNTTPELNIYHIAKDNTETLIDNKAQINNAFKISWSENKDYNVILSYEEDGEIKKYLCSNGDIISKELNLSKQTLSSKKYTITVTNKAGTEKVYYIYLCNTFLGCSVYLGSKLQDSSISNFITNQSVKFVLNSGTATLNNEAYKSNTRIEEDGLYNLIITDEYGNEFEYSFEIDTIAPNVELTSTTFLIENGTNGDVSLILDDLEAKIYQIESEIKKEIPTGFIFSNEGNYKLEIIDKANNITSITFIIDKTTPTFEASGFTTNPTITKTTVKITWSESDATATLNSLAYKSNTKIEEDGIYEFILSDIYGNQTIFNFEIDSKMLEYVINGINDKFYSNDFVNIEFDENKITAILKSKNSNDLYRSGIGIIEEGEYTIILTSIEMPDKSYSIDFVIDKTTPTLELETISSFGFIIEDNKYYTNNSFFATFNTKENTCFINNSNTNKEYTSEKIIKEEGNYELTLTDLAGNSTIYFICIDKSDISFNLLNENNENLDYKLNESTSTTRTNYYNSSLKLELPNGAKAKIGEIEYISNSLITEEGEYTITLTNKLGTVSILKLTIDKTAPLINVTGINENSKTCNSIKITIEELNTYQVFINDEIKTVYSISDNGSYTIKCIDVAGNESSTSVEILARDLKEFVTLSQDDNLYTATLNVAELENYKISIDGKEVESINEYNTPGKHQLIITDEYGNTYSTSFTISQPVSPSYVFNNVMTYILIVLIVAIIIVFIVKKIKNGKKNPYLKG